MIDINAYFSSTENTIGINLASFPLVLLFRFYETFSRSSALPSNFVYLVIFYRLTAVKSVRLIPVCDLVTAGDILKLKSTAATTRIMPISFTRVINEVAG